jgi:hypothetical protein
MLLSTCIRGVEGASIGNEATPFLINLERPASDGLQWRVQADVAGNLNTLQAVLNTTGFIPHNRKTL